MDEWRSNLKRITDSHVHMRSIDDEQSLLTILKSTDIDRMALVSIQDPHAGRGLPQSLYMKARYPDRFFVFAGLNHAERLSAGQIPVPSLVQQAEMFYEMGCDGIKMIEGKPTSRQRMDIPLTDPYYADYWAWVEEKQLPIVLHVNDPEEFWDPSSLPQWARDQGWGYGPDDVQKEQLYAEVEKVLDRHPDLQVTFAHFYFLSADLDRARRLLDAHPTIRIDLAPGVEMLHNLSQTPETARDFFIQYADRILFGSDISSDHTVEEATIRAGIVFRWLEGNETFCVPPEADILLGGPEDGQILGMALPQDVLQRICSTNFARLVSKEPRPLDIAQAANLCQELAAIAEALSGRPRAQTEAARVAQTLSTDDWRP